MEGIEAVVDAEVAAVLQNSEVVGDTRSAWGDHSCSEDPLDVARLGLGPCVDHIAVEVVDRTHSWAVS